MWKRQQLFGSDRIVLAAAIRPERGSLSTTLLVEREMAKVRLEIMSWLSPHFGAQHSGRLALEEEIQEGESVRELLNRLAAKHKDFGELAFDPQTQRLTGNVNLVFNDRLIELVNGLETRMKDGDTIVFLPAYAGGAKV